MGTDNDSATGDSPSITAIDDRLLKDNSRQSHRRRLWMSWKLWLLGLFAGLFVIATVIGVPAYRRWSAFEHLRDNTRDGVQFEYASENEWYVEQFGDIALGFRQVESMRLTSPSDETLSQVVPFKEVTELTWSSTRQPRPINANVVNTIRSFPNLRELKIWGPGFTDEILARILASPPELVRVELWGTEAGSRTLRALAQIPSLETLYISKTPLPDHVFDDLEPFTNLRTMLLTNTDIGDAGVAWFARCPELRDVGLNISRATDASLESISQLPYLETVGLFDSPRVTEEGIAYLEGSPHLWRVAVYGYLITPATIESFCTMPALTTVNAFMGFPHPELKDVLRREWPGIGYD